MKCELVSSLADINKGEWDSLNTSNHPFTSYDFLNSLEISQSVSPKTGWNPQHIIIKDGDVFALRERVRLRLVRGERHGLGRGYAAIRGGNRQVRFLLLCLLLLLRLSLLGPPNFSFVARGQILFVSPLFLFGYVYSPRIY